MEFPEVAQHWGVPPSLDANTCATEVAPRRPHITLLRPPAISSRFTYTIGVVLPLGPAYVAGALLERGYRVAVVDAVGEAPLQSGPTSQPNLVYHGLSIPEIIDRIDPATDAVGISVMFSQQWPYVDELVEQSMSGFLEIPIFIGGEHAAGAWDFVLDTCAPVTACAIGEGEETMQELAEYVSGRRRLADVKGIACRIDGRAQLTAPRARIRNLGEIAARRGISFRSRTTFRAASATKLIGMASICGMDTAAREYCVIGDARRASFFFGRVNDGKLMEGPSLHTGMELEMKIMESSVPLYASELLPQFHKAALTYPSARRLAELARDQAGEIADTRSLEPIYLREPHITVPKASRASAIQQ